MKYGRTLPILFLLIALVLSSCGGTPPELTTQQITQDLAVYNGYSENTENLVEIISDETEKDLRYLQVSFQSTAPSGEITKATYNVTYRISDQPKPKHWVYTEGNLIESNVFSPIGDSSLYAAYVNQVGLTGIYNIDTDTYVTMPEYESVSTFSENGLCLVKKNGYYGFIDRTGAVVIDFQYSKAESFQGERAIVAIDGNYGLIDSLNQFLIPPKFEEITPLEQYFIVSQHKETYKTLYDSSGAVVIEGDYYDYLIDAEYLFAGNPYENELTLYHLDGTPVAYDTGLIGQAVGYQCTAVKSVSILGENQLLLYCTFQDSGETGKGYVLTDYSLTPLSPLTFHSAIPFNDFGYAILRTSGFEMIHSTLFSDHYGWNNYKDWVVIDQSSEIVCTLPEPLFAPGRNAYTSSNGYYVIAIDNNFASLTDLYATIHMQTGELTTWREATPVKNTYCIIVLDQDTGLYGLYDGYDLVCPCKYSSIEYDGSQFLLTTGAATEFYTPVAQAP